jgi:hypothetical protein
VIVEKSARAAFYLLLLFVTWQTITPDPDQSKNGLAFARWIASLLLGDVTMADKVAHFCAYAALGFLAALGGIRIFGRPIFSLAGLIAYGAALELLQGLGGVRIGDWVDASMNASGAMSGFALARLARYAREIA